MKKETLELAKSAFEIEAEVLLDTAKNMDWQAFETAVKLLSKAERIAASGCGHSGIACRHFAHSMCCIEKPARFLSPSEAVHGATGFLKSGDVLVVASRGGKTLELLQIIEIAKKKNVSVISVIEDIDTPIASLSDVTLPIKVYREVDRYNMQGTSSFVAVCAVFDALQVAVMEETGFHGDQFGLIHPGGAVGERLSKKEPV